MQFRGRIPAIFALIASCAAGCASAPAGPAFVTVPQEHYARAFDAACAAARAEGLVPVLADRESGVLRTAPRQAGSMIEPWTWSDLTANEVVEGTFGFERRRAHFEFVPAGFKPVAPEGNAPLAGPVLPGSERGSGSNLPQGATALELRVSVSIERQFRPGYQGPAYTRALGGYARDAMSPDASSPDSTASWTPIARDERLERALLTRVAESLQGQPELR